MNETFTTAIKEQVIYFSSNTIQFESNNTFQFTFHTDAIGSGKSGRGTYEVVGDKIFFTFDSSWRSDEFIRNDSIIVSINTTNIKQADSPCKAYEINISGLPYVTKNNFLQLLALFNSKNQITHSIKNNEPNKWNIEICDARVSDFNLFHTYNISLDDNMKIGFYSSEKINLENCDKRKIALRQYYYNDSDLMVAKFIHSKELLVIQLNDQTYFMKEDRVH